MRSPPCIRVMGIDPGLSFTGYGAVESGPAGRLRYLVSGTIPTSSRAPFVDRLVRIHRDLQTVFEEVRPDHVAVEEVFFARHARSALLLGHARGVVILSAAMAGIPVFEYAATEAKKAVCTYGRAGKEQVGAMVKALLRLDQDLSDHASDALALCICHIHSRGALPAGAGRRTSRTSGDLSDDTVPGTRKKGVPS